MAGPVRNALLDAGGGQEIWIRRLAVELLDAKGRPVPEALCHANLHVLNQGADGRTLRPQLSLSSGETSFEFPSGYALRLAANPNRRVALSLMILNRRRNRVGQRLDPTAVLEYFDSGQAKQLGLKPLRQDVAAALCIPEDVPGGQCRPASVNGRLKGGDGRTRTGHWLVPPGGQVLRTPVEWGSGHAVDTTARIIWLHVHRYARSVALWDVTARRLVWKGDILALPDGETPIAPRYSGSEGMRLFADHHYELETIYDNPTTNWIDAMAAVYVFLDDSP